MIFCFFNILVEIINVMEKNITKKYKNKDLTILWQPSLCIHSTKCWKGEEGLLNVFNPGTRPWINPEGASTDAIIAQINKCPSGALSFVKNEATEAPSNLQIENIIEVSKNGPLLVYGNIKLKNKEGDETRKNKVTALCRCGASQNKPYCDGSHVKIGFKDE